MIIFNLATSKTQVKRTKPRLQSGQAVRGLTRQSSFSKLPTLAPENYDKDIQSLRTNALHRSFDSSLNSICESFDGASQHNKRSRPRSQSGDAVSTISRQDSIQVLNLVAIRDVEFRNCEPLTKQMSKRSKPRLQSGAAVSHVTIQDVAFVKMSCLPEMNDRDVIRRKRRNVSLVRSE
jgi:hypothetical protein